MSATYITLVHMEILVISKSSSKFNDFEEYCDNLCDWYNIYDKEQLKADIEDAYHSQEITN